MNSYQYQGSELEIFAQARNWKTYFSARLRRYISGEVIEAGAGLGANTPFLSRNASFSNWLGLEPDGENCRRLAGEYARQGDARFRALCGTLAVAASADTILYIDVLEHIEDDRGELELAVSKLRPGGHLIVLSPAHQSLYSAFDKSIGHYRRYTRKSLLAIAPTGARLQRCFYLDSTSLLASFANKALLKQSLPTLKQILFWDRVLVPLSRVSDVLFAGSLGKSVIAIWRKS